MLAALFLAVGLVVIGVSIGVPFYVFSRRERFLTTLPATARAGLERTVSGLFDAPPGSSIVAPATTRLAGASGGEAIELDVAFTKAVNGAWIRSGAKSFIVAEHTLRLGLRGATPAFAVTPKRARRPRYYDLTGPRPHADLGAFEITAGDDVARAVVDDELRAELLAFVNRVGHLRSIAITPRGLEITWLGAGGAAAGLNPPRAGAVEALDRARFVAARALAGKLQERILRALEEQARARVRIGGYRAGDAAIGPEADDASEEHAERARRA